MALIYSPSLSSLFLGQGIRNGFQGNSTCGVAIMSGLVPTAADVAANWTTYHYLSPTFLAVALCQFGFVQNNVLLGLTVNPGNITADKSGTATWAYVFDNNNIGAGSLTGSIPSTKFLICSVSDVAGSGVFRLNTTDLIAGQTFQITDAGFTASIG